MTTILLWVLMADAILANLCALFLAGGQIVQEIVNGRDEHATERATVHHDHTRYR
ncbi:hypothetical protein [Parafrankia discariae]|uniref:hypothetical protein n=1 Tax=Parafrankia discariae TaxID=365528 RepID=UPI000372A469|nr:hypothetical protein [Parafrankia discariae]